MSHMYGNLFLGTLPKRLVLRCVDNGAFNERNPKNPFTPITTTSTSSPCKWTVDICPPNIFDRNSRIGGTSGVTSTCSPRPVRCRRTKGMSDALRLPSRIHSFRFPPQFGRVRRVVLSPDTNGHHAHRNSLRWGTRSDRLQ